MILKRFRLLIAIRIILLSGTIALFFFFLLNQSAYLIVAVILGLLIIYQIYRLFYQFDRTNQELTRFLGAIRYSDFSQSFSSPEKSNSFKELERSFSEIIDQFRKTRAEKEEQTRYLQTIVQHVGVGLLSFDQGGNVELINNAAKRLLNVTVLRDITSLSEISPELLDIIRKLRNGDHITVPFRKNDDENKLLSLYATEFKRKGKSYTLLSLQDIRSEMEEQELEAWQKLTRVLTHEIMNSITPISSLSSTLNSIISEKNGPELSDDTWEDIRLGLSTIEKRSKALIRFVEDYRKFTRVRTPQISSFAVKDLFDRVHRLIDPLLERKHIRFRQNIIPKDLELHADQDLVEQALINIIKNATQSIDSQENAEILLQAEIGKDSRLIIQVQDNGPGIPDEVREKIFVPFYSTRNSGSGIGLSLCKQIMRMHNGTITVQSKPDVKTTFTLKF